MKTTLELLNRRGLHARASAKFVETVEPFDAEVTVGNGEHEVGGESIMGLMGLGAAWGDKIYVETSGPQEAEAMAAIEALVAARFGEED